MKVLSLAGAVKVLVLVGAEKVLALVAGIKTREVNGMAAAAREVSACRSCAPDPVKIRMDEPIWITAARVWTPVLVAMARLAPTYQKKSDAPS